MDLITILNNTFIKCSKLQIQSEKELLECMSSLSICKYNHIDKRIITNEESTIDFILSSGIFNFESKSDIRKLIKNNGLKINNKPIPDKICDIEWITLNDVQYAIIKKGKNDFDFIFKQFILS